MIGYYLGDPVEVLGDYNDGWVGGRFVDDKKEKVWRFWGDQILATPPDQNLRERGVARHDQETSTPGFEQPDNERIDLGPPTGKGDVENRESSPLAQGIQEAFGPDVWRQLADRLAAALREALIDVGAKGVDDPYVMRGARVGREALEMYETLRRASG